MGLLACLLTLTSPSTACHAIRAMLAARRVRPMGMAGVVLVVSGIVGLRVDEFGQVEF